MTSRDFIKREFGNADGNDKAHSSIKKDGLGNIYSYGSHYPLLFTVNGFTFRNVRGYSNTTAKHISWCWGFDAIDVVLDEQASEVVARLFATEPDKMREVNRCLYLQLRELMDKMESKKRRDTWVYRDLQRQHEQVYNNINAISTEVMV